MQIYIFARARNLVVSSLSLGSQFWLKLSTFLPLASFKHSVGFILLVLFCLLPVYVIPMLHFLCL